jgi:hypothetical protein
MLSWGVGTCHSWPIEALGARSKPTRIRAEFNQRPRAGDFIAATTGGRWGVDQPEDYLELSIKHTRGMPGPGAYFRDFQVGARSRRRFAPPRILCAPDSLTRFGASETTPRPHPASRTASSCART